MTLDPDATVTLPTIRGVAYVVQAHADGSTSHTPRDRFSADDADEADVRAGGHSVGRVYHVAAIGDVPVAARNRAPNGTAVIVGNGASADAWVKHADTWRRFTYAP